MNQKDLEYGKVLVTGELAFYMQHPKGRIITERAKEVFLVKWIKQRIKNKKDRNDVRKALQRVKSHKQLVKIWEMNLRTYLIHIKNCRYFLEYGKSDRELVEETLNELSELGFFAQSKIGVTHEFSDEAIEKTQNKGAIVMLEVLEERFDENGKLKDDQCLELAATNPNVIEIANLAFAKRCFPLNVPPRHDVISMTSAHDHVRRVLNSID